MQVSSPLHVQQIRMVSVKQNAVFSEGEESLVRSNYFCSIFLWNLLAWVLWFFFFQHQNFSRLFYYNSCLLSFSEIKIISFSIMPIVTKLRVGVESLENLFVFWLFWPSRLYVLQAMKLLIIRQMELIMMCFCSSQILFVIKVFEVHGFTMVGHCCGCLE